MSEDLDRNQLARELLRLAYAHPVDTIMLINIACRMALAERNRAVDILEFSFETLQKTGKLETVDCLMKLRDKIVGGVDDF
jgi:hypothetical protein